MDYATLPIQFVGEKLFGVKILSKLDTAAARRGYSAIDMAQNGDFDWSPNIPLKIYGTDYIGFIRRLVKVLGKNSQTRFIERGVENTKYVNIMLETHHDERALEVHMRQDNLYVEAMGRRGGQYTIFKLNGVKNFGAGSKELGFGENYTSLTRHLGDSIYSLNFLEFTQAVETLIEYVVNAIRLVALQPTNGDEGCLPSLRQWRRQQEAKLFHYPTINQESVVHQHPHRGCG
ncbi:hypothetical protein Tco_1420098 [Tanacetum coccineum]